MADGDEQSIRILPSQSRVMNRNVGVHLGVDHGQVQAVALADLAPVGDAGPAERVGADAHPGGPDRGQVDHLAQRRHVGVRGSRTARWCRPPAARAYGIRRTPGQPVGQQLVGPVLDLPGDVGAGRPAVRRVVLEAAVRRRVVRRRDHDPVRARPGTRPRCAPGSPGTRPASACTRRGRRVSTRTPLAASTSSALTCAGSDSACVSAPRNSGPSMPVPGPVLADRLGGGQDVVLVERRGQRRPAVPGRAERHPLGRLAGIGMHGVVGGDQLGHVDEVFGGSGLPGTRIGHAAILTRRS